MVPQGYVRMISPLSTAVIGALEDSPRPIVTNYELFRIVWDIYENPSRYPVKIIRRVKAPGYTQYSRVINDLSRERLIRIDPDFGSSYGVLDTKTRVFRISEVPDAPAEDIACLVDPFAFVSHLSAMQRYGLTVRQPETLTLTTPKGKLWSQRRDEKMRQDYGFDPAEAELDYFKPLQAITIPEQLRNRKVHVRHSVRSYASQPIMDSFARIIEIGDLFVQMLDDPDLCGGMEHVLEIWEEHGEVYLDAIIRAVNEAPTDIIRVRAGYILEAHLEVDDPRIDAWKRCAQRGGSRKLNPSKPYGPPFSETWMLSLNV